MFAWAAFFPLLPGLAAAGPIEVRPPLTSGAVLQRGAPVTVSGTAAPNAAVSVRLAGQTVEVHADEEGRWTARLGPFATTTEPLALTAAGADGDETVVSDLLIGDVFIAAGQSNMWWPLQQTDGNNAVLRRAPENEALRLYREPPRCALSPRRAAGRWTGSSWDEAKQFSAIGYHFGRAYAVAEGVPVGIVLAARGGSLIDAWLPPATLQHEAAADRAAAIEAQAGERSAFVDALPSWLAMHGDDPEGAPAPPPWPTDADLASVPGCYWDGMLHGLMTMPIAGMLWYQGETDAQLGTPDYASRLADLFDAFSYAWGADLPVVVFGLPPYEPVPTTATVRAAQEATTAADPRTVLVPANDPAADPLELHPRPKRGPAERAAAAMHRLRSSR